MKLEDKFKSKDLPGGYTLEELNELTNSIRLAKLENATVAGNANKERLNNPKELEKTKDVIKKTWENEDVRKSRIDGQVEWHTIEENKLEHSRKTKEALNKPGVKDKMSKKAKENMNDPEIKAKHKKRMKEVTEDPAYRKNLSDAMNRPEVMEKLKQPKPRSICPKCGEEGPNTGITRYHGKEGEKCTKKKLDEI